MNFVRKTAIPLAIIVAVAIQLVALTAYWTVDFLVFMIGFLPAVIIIGLTLIWSVIAIFAYRGLKRALPLGLMITSLALAFNVPYAEFSMHLDFKLKQHAMTEIALKAQHGALPYDVMSSDKLESGRLFIEYKLPEERRYLSIDKSFFTSNVMCGKYVFFPTFYGIPDGAGGFLFVPDCAKPEQFPGERFGAKWIGVTRLEGRWFRIDGT